MIQEKNKRKEKEYRRPKKGDWGNKKRRQIQDRRENREARRRRSHIRMKGGDRNIDKSIDECVNK